MAGCSFALARAAWFLARRDGIDGAYVPLPVRPGLEQALRALPVLGFRGCNLTIPHKQAALEVVDRVDPFARRIGAMNTIVVAADGSLEGSNTDVFGFRENLREQAPNWDAKAGPAVVLGGGGSAVGRRGADRRWGCEIRLVNRTVATPKVARDLARGNPDHRPCVGNADAVLDEAGILVNTTSLGMDKEPPLDIDLSFAVIGGGRRYRLRAARDRAARGGAAARPSGGRWARHVAASRPPGIRGMVRHRGPGHPRAAARRCCGPLRRDDRPRPHRVHRHGQEHRRCGAAPARGTAVRRRSGDLQDVGTRRLGGGSKVEAAFPGVRGEDGAIDRALLGQRVFGKPAELRRLEKILHPMVRAVETPLVSAVAWPKSQHWLCWISRFCSRPTALSRCCAHHRGLGPGPPAAGARNASQGNERGALGGDPQFTVGRSREATPGRFCRQHGA